MAPTARGHGRRRGATGWSAAWTRYRESVGVQLALDAVPDPVTGLIVYKGRGGNSGTRKPRKPRPLIGSGAASLPLPLDQRDHRD